MACNLQEVCRAAPMTLLQPKQLTAPRHASAPEFNQWEEGKLGGGR
jgi:hypothetical protein